MSDVSVDIIKNRNGEAPDLPSGANLSGVSTAATLQVTNLNPTHINASGVTTATTFSGSLKSTGTPTLGLGVTINSSGLNISGVATAGIVSATTLYGDGSNLTGVAMSIAPISYNPDVGDSSVGLQPGIGITFTERIKAGSGNITLSIATNAGAAGTFVEAFGVGSSVTINNNTLTFTPTSNLTVLDTYHVGIPAGAVTNTSGDVSVVETNWTFQARDYEYQIWAWGMNENGQLAQNNTTTLSSPVQITGTTWSAIIEGHHGYNTDNSTANMAKKSDGTLWSWGYNQFGELGQNSRTLYSSPIQIPGTTWATGSRSWKNMFGVKTDGTLWVWGANENGQLGINNTTKYSSPVQVPGTTWSTNQDHISAQNRKTYAIKTDGTMWAWGYENRGSLGLNGSVAHGGRISSPAQIPGSTWSKLALGGMDAETYGTDCMAAIRTDGTLWVWGNNESGALGLNAPANSQYSSPVQLPGTNWSEVVKSHGRSMMAIKTDGTLWGWGRNENGQLGLNESPGSPSHRSSPTQIPGTTWNSITSGTHTLATKTDGTLWTWGKNNHGGLGQNSTVYRSSPVQVPGTTWFTNLTGSWNTGFATKRIQTSY